MTCLRNYTLIRFLKISLEGKGNCWPTIFSLLGFQSLQFTNMFFSSLYFLLGHGRGRRSHNLKDISPCTPEGQKKWLDCLVKQNGNRKGYLDGTHVAYDLKCTYETYSCFYVYTCKPKIGGYYACSQDAHFINYTGLCCYPIC